MAPKQLQPFFRAGTAEFIRALKVATPAEAAMWKRFKVAQFKPEDPRLKTVTGAAKKEASPDYTSRMLGEA